MIWIFLISLFSGITSLNSSQPDSNAIGVGDGIVDGNFIGGYYKSDVNSFPIYKKTPIEPTISVTNADQFVKALENAENGTQIYLDGDSSFDLSAVGTINLKGNITLFSNRGENKALGALIFTTNLDTNPLFVTKGGNIRIIGIRFRGPDPTVVNFKELKSKFSSLSENDIRTSKASYGIPNSSLIHVFHRNITVENCEILNWSHSGVFVRKGGDASIHHNYIHHNQRRGLGYGVMIDNGIADIKANIFDFNRHAIAGTGTKGTSFQASYNIALPNSTLQGHVFDMHGGSDRKDGTNIAGNNIHIHNNLFYVVSNQVVVLIRGKPLSNAVINNNEFREVNNGSTIQRPELFIKQINAKGNLSLRNNRITK